MDEQTDGQRIFVHEDPVNCIKLYLNDFSIDVDTLQKFVLLLVTHLIADVCKASNCRDLLSLLRLHALDTDSSNGAICGAVLQVDDSPRRYWRRS